MTVSAEAVDTMVQPDCAGGHRACDDKPVDRCEVVTDFDRLQQFWPDWQRLWQSDQRAEIFQTPEWSKAWWSAFGHSYNLCSIMVFAREQVVGIVPLVMRDQQISFLGTPESDYADILCEDHRAAEVLAAALETLAESVRGWQECRFEHLSKHSRLVRHYGQLARKVRGRLHCLPAEQQQTIILRNQREEVFKALLGKHHTKRLQNKLRKAGKLEFRYLENPCEVDQHLREFFRQHVRRHATIGRRSAYSEPEACQFLRSVMQEIGLNGRTRFGVLELDGRPLAWAVGFHVNGKFLLYQHTFDLDAGHYTPGEVLLWNTLEYARDHVSREFDFGKGDELYKDRFTNYSRQTCVMFFERAGLRGSVRGWKHGIEARLQPSLWKLREIAKSRRSTLRAFRAARIWMLGVKSGMLQARKNGDTVPYALHLAKEAFGSAIWRRRATEIFTLEASRGLHGVSAGISASCEIEVARAQFGDLVDLAWDHPEILSLSELSDCRERLKNGDRPYIVREKATVVMVCWAADHTNSDHTNSDRSTSDHVNSDGTKSNRAKSDDQKNKDEAGSSTTRLAINLSTPTIVADEFWRARGRDLSAVYKSLLCALIADAAARKADLLVHCASDQAQLRRELERQGFRPRFRYVRHKIFGRFRRESLSEHPNQTVHSSQVA